MTTRAEDPAAGDGAGRVAVTGSSGQLGGAVVARLLADGWQVVGVDRAPARIAHPALTAVTWDGRDLAVITEALAGCSGVIHLAAIPAPYAHPDEVVFGNNTTSTFAALQAATLNGVDRAVIASSISAYGTAYHPENICPLYAPVDEAHPLIAADPYALSKEADEATARMFVRRYGMSVAALRFSWIATRSAQLASPSLHGDLASGQQPRILWSYVDERDAARACVLALTAPDPFGFAALNVVAADVLAREALADLIARYAPQVEIRHDAGPTGGGFDISRAEQLIGWRPEHTWRDPDDAP